MSKTSNREKIITEGLRVVHEYGYAGTSVRDISRAAGVPLGSFTNHFPSKEAFALEVLERYQHNGKAAAMAILGDQTKPVGERLTLYLDHITKNLLGADFRNGCLVGNLCAEVSNQSDTLRTRLVIMLEEKRTVMRVLLNEGVASGELPADLNVEMACGFIYYSLQGAVLAAKALRSEEPVNEWRQYIMNDILKLDVSPNGGFE